MRHDDGIGPQIRISMCEVTSRNFTVDIHTHILPRDIPNFRERFGYGGFISLDHHMPSCARMMKDDHFFRGGKQLLGSWDAHERMRPSVCRCTGALDRSSNVQPIGPNPRIRLKWQFS